MTTENSNEVKNRNLKHREIKRDIFVMFIQHDENTRKKNKAKQK